MSWSGHDAGLLLSSAKDHRTVLWDVASGEVLGEVPAGDSWDFDVLWSPNNPGVFATSSYGTGEGSSGKVSTSLEQSSYIPTPTHLVPVAKPMADAKLMTSGHFWAGFYFGLLFFLVSLPKN